VNETGFLQGNEMSKPLRYQRPFEVWTYRPSHSQLLLRSNKGDDRDDRATRVEVLFRGVSFMKLPTVLDELEVTSAAPEQVGLRANDVGDRRVFLLGSSSLGAFVVAYTVEVHEDEGEYFDASNLLDTTSTLGSA
jgi:hypothetical protein